MMALAMRLANRGWPMMTAVFLAFAVGYMLGVPTTMNASGSVLPGQADNPEQARADTDLSGNIVKGLVRSHMERHACLSQVQFTSLELELPNGSNMEVMLPLQVRTLEQAVDLFPKGKVELFRLNRVQNIKSTDGTQLYAVADASFE